MEQSKQHNEKSIELRSEKVRNIIGQIPSLLVRQGASIIGVVLLVLLGISAFVPYRKTIPVNIRIHHTPKLERISIQKDGIFCLDTTVQEVKVNQIIGNLFCNDSLLPIKSKIAGQLIWNVNNNDSVKKNDLLGMVIPQQIQNTYGECLLDVSQKTMVAKGQKVMITNSFGKMFEGKITKIYPIVSDSKCFKVRIEFAPFKIKETYPKGQIVLSESSFLRFFMKSFKF